MSKIDEMINELCPEGVEMVKLGDVCSAVFAGGTPSTSRDDYYDGTIPWIRSGEIDFNRIFNAERNITDLGLANSSAKLIKPFSVVMAMTGATVAKVATVEIETSANQSVCALEANKDNMDYRYLYYYLSAHYHDIKSSAQGALTSLNLQMIKALQIPLPPLTIQQKIVSVLDSFTTLIDKMKQEVEKRKKQMEYYREKLLTFEDGECEWKTLGEISHFRRGSFPQPYGLAQWYDGEGSMPFVQVADVNDYGFGLATNTKRRISKLAQPMSVYIPKGSVIVTLQGTIGRVAITDYDCYMDRTLAYFDKIDDAINTKYFAHQLKRKFGIEKEHARGNVIKTITKEEFQNFEIALPSYKNQCIIVSTLDKFESYITKLEKMIVLRQKQYEYYREQLLTFI